MKSRATRDGHSGGHSGGIERLEEEGEYVLGTDPAELERLRFQHEAWVRAAHELFERGGLREGMTVLDLGCGPGLTTLELATAVGPRGRVIAADQSERFLATLRQECARLGLANVEPRLGAVEELALPPGGLDAAYSRWLLCWLPDPFAVLERVARALRPRGVFLLQEYLDWGAVRLVPHGPALSRCVEACLASFRAVRATMDFAAEVPALAPRAGLELEHFAPRARLGAVGSLEWRWVGAFLRLYLPKVVEAGLLRPPELDACLREWDEREAGGASWIQTPTMADLVLRRSD